MMIISLLLLLLFKINITSAVVNDRSDKALNGNIMSTEGEWGDWDSWQYCNENYFMDAIKIGYEEDNFGDIEETAANIIGIHCTNNEWIFSSIQHINRVDYNASAWCSSGALVFGFKALVESNQGIVIDDTALNNIEIICNNNDYKIPTGVDMLIMEFGVMKIHVIMDKLFVVLELKYNQIKEHLLMILVLMLFNYIVVILMDHTNITITTNIK